MRRPIVPPDCEHNAHMYYLLLPDLAARTRFIAGLKERGIAALFHYVPLHDSPGGREFGRPHGTLSVTSETSERLVRLPLRFVGRQHRQRKAFERHRRPVGPSFRVARGRFAEHVDDEGFIDQLQRPRRIASAWRLGEGEAAAVD